MTSPDIEKVKKELNALPTDWKPHPSRKNWFVLEGPDGRKITYHAGRGTYRLHRNVGTISASPREMYEQMFEQAPPQSDIETAPFGKYKGHPLPAVVQDDSDYAEWMLSVAETDWLREALERELGKE